MVLEYCRCGGVKRERREGQKVVGWRVETDKIILEAFELLS